MTSGVRRALTGGRLREAVAAYAGPVLPASEAPGVVEIRDDLRLLLRERLIGGGDPEALLAYAQSPEGREDHGVWTATATALPAGSAHRAIVEQHLSGWTGCSPEGQGRNVAATPLVLPSRLGVQSAARPARPPRGRRSRYS